ncbi:hypothetical protein H8356DRAFT_1361193 [Neocallimastix lanati (nom. inval.)]|nr:hypothetical protein H8356DRAFT_1361193 [Neocallimastix sp. JGI-2020a]
MLQPNALADNESFIEIFIVYFEVSLMENNIPLQKLFDKALSKRLFLGGILDSTPVILLYDLIIGTEDIMVNGSYSDARGMLGNTAPGRCYASISHLTVISVMVIMGDGYSLWNNLSFHSGTISACSRIWIKSLITLSQFLEDHVRFMYPFRLSLKERTK